MDIKIDHRDMNTVATDRHADEPEEVEEYQDWDARQYERQQDEELMEEK